VILPMLNPIHHRPTWAAITAERAFLEGLGGGCALPVAAYADANGSRLQLRGLVASPDGQHIVRVAGNGSAADGQRLGQRLAREAMAQGAGELLEVPA
jgi:hydroxymethylbilane synthase